MRIKYDSQYDALCIMHSKKKKKQLATLAISKIRKVIYHRDDNERADEKGRAM